jgi:hypothetical protein
MMGDKNDSGHRTLIWLLLFTGFCGIGGLAGILLLRIPMFFSLGFWVMLIVGLGLGGYLLKKSERRASLVLGALLAAVVLGPIYVPTGIGLAVYWPVLWGHAQGVFTGPDVEISVPSPDGAFIAYVVNHPSVDPPNQSLYIERGDKIHFNCIAKLPEDVDSIQEIRWSADSAIVVFQTRFSIYAVHLPDYKMVQIPLGTEWKRSKPNRNSTFNASGGGVVKAIEFPKAGCFGYQLEGTEEIKVIEMSAL